MLWNVFIKKTFWVCKILFTIPATKWQLNLAQWQRLGYNFRDIKFALQGQVNNNIQLIKIRLPLQGASFSLNEFPRRCHWAKMNWAFSPKILQNSTKIYSCN
jgi:hypothetical protein